MSETRWLKFSDRWVRLLMRLYPSDFRDEMGDAVVEAYRDRCRAALRDGGRGALVWVWLRALADSLRNGFAEQVRPARGVPRNGSFGRDAQLVVRRLTRAPVFTLSMVGLLTVGLGAFATVYAVVDRVLLAPLPYRQAEDLYVVWRDYTWIGLDRGWLGGTDVVELAKAKGVVEGAVALDRNRATLTNSRGGEPREIALMTSSPGLFPLLGVKPALGRGFTSNEFGPGRPATIVLGHNLWRDHFGADRGVIGREVRLDGQPYRVIGVMGRDFRFARSAGAGPAERADAYTTLDLHLASTDPDAGSYGGLIRARPGTPPATVMAAVGAVGSVVDRRDFEAQGLRLRAIGLKDDLVSRVRPALIALALSGVLLVVVLGVNVGTLLLVRAAQREREFAISRALGAHPGALARATLLEGGILGALGGACGAFAAVWGTRALVAIAPDDLPLRDAIAVDWRIALTVTLIGAGLGVAASAYPAVATTRMKLAGLMRNAAVRGGGGGHGRMRRGMVVLQVALSLVLLSAGGLVTRSFERLLRAEPGFEPSGVLAFKVPLPAGTYDSPPPVFAALARIQQELSTLPGVTAVGATQALPLSAGADQRGIAFPGAPGNTGNEDLDEPMVDLVVTWGGYFEAMGIRFVAGRGFGAAGGAAGREVIIDRILAERFFPGRDPIGATLHMMGDSARVVGVVNHARQYDVHQDGRPQVYWRYEEYPERVLFFALRTKRDAASLAPDARAAVARIDPGLAVTDFRTMDQRVADSLRQQRVGAVLIGGFSLGALLLAAIGLFGVVAGSVSRRRHELAVRLALGADHRRVVGMVLREGAGLILLGVLVGLPGVYLMGRAIRGVLVGVTPADPLALATAACSLALVALAACYLPARRVTRIEPAASLRQE
ncbi:MAG TPA: ADOP family duplicated permease [Longimicrobium sp.]|jgi:putative ABC transport system permease protein